MRKKLYFLLPAFFFILFFIISATCNMCAADIATDTTISDKEEVSSVDTREKTEPTNTNEETIENTLQDNEETDKKAPAIKLEISDGPFYSAADDVCYWRVRATVTGTPSPGISWSQDASNGSFGKNIAQINLTRDNPEYTLTATAANSEGTATDSITLNWGCESDEAEGEESPVEEEPAESEPLSLNLHQITSEGGYIEQNGAVNTGGCIFIGDSNNNKPVRGLISYDISDLSDANITKASLTLDLKLKWGDPAAFNSFSLCSAYWGTGPIVQADFMSPCRIGIGSFGIGNGNITIDTGGLEDAVQDAIDQNWDRLQIMFWFSILTDGNNTWDGWEYEQNDIKLNIEYTD
jgi:hypothetical protein